MLRLDNQAEHTRSMCEQGDLGVREACNVLGCACASICRLQVVYQGILKTMMAEESGVHAPSSSKVSCHLCAAKELFRRHAALHSKILSIRSRGLACA